MDILEKSYRFIYKNARPLDLARWKFHFENGTQENILKALSVYQNDDGGFGHALEPDCFNPHSSPIQTWAATEILREINFIDRTHPVIQGILKYLSSGANFDKTYNQWLNTVPSNNNFPHAIWWKYNKNESEFKYNPTASLSGFAIKFADKESELYEKSFKIASQAYEFFRENYTLEETHVTSCFVSLYEYLSEAEADFINMDEFACLLKFAVEKNICHDIKKWGNEYVSMPSDFIKSPESIFFNENKELIESECRFIVSGQLDDGSYPVPWQWWTEYKEFEIAVNWWKSNFVIKNMIFLRNFGKI